jgi:hypothetical protein
MGSSQSWHCTVGYLPRRGPGVNVESSETIRGAHKADPCYHCRAMTDPVAFMPSVERILAHLDPEILDMAEERLLPDLPQERIDAALYQATATATAELLGHQLPSILDTLHRELEDDDPRKRANAIVKLVFLGATERAHDIEERLKDHATAEYGDERPSEACDDNSRRQLGTFMAVVKGSGQRSLPGQPLGRGRFRAEVSDVASWGLSRLAVLPKQDPTPG